MPLDYLRLFSPIISFFINVACNIYICRYYLSRLGLLKSIIIAFLIGFFILLTIEFYYLSNTAQACLDGAVSSFIANVIIYFSFGYCYFHFINLGETGRRIRILRELYESDRGLSEEEIMARYNAQEIFERRIKRLIASRQITFRGRRYYVNNSLLLLAFRIIVAIKYILFAKKN